MEQQPKVKSLYKALKLLDYFSTTTTELRITELAELSHLQKSSVYNIMQTFECCNIVKKGSNNKYSLGKKVLELYHKCTVNFSFQSQLKECMTNIASITGEKVYFAVPYDTNIIYLDAISVKDQYLSKSLQGVVSPMYCTGLGKAMLAFSCDDIQERVLSSNLCAYTNNTIINREKLIQEILLIKKNGYSVDNMEHEFGVKCVACPLFENNNIAGAISISGPSLRFDDEKIKYYAEMLISVSRELSK